MSDPISIQFLGAAQCVTGSKYLLRTQGSTTLVDCGLFQGMKALRLRNWEPLSFPASKIDQVILTHAHIDHTGYLPRLCKEGFQGPIFCTPSTRELLGLLLPDCGKLQEEDARYAARKGSSKHSPPLPLFTAQDGFNALRFLRPVEFGRSCVINEALTFRYHPAGHILGSASLEMTIGTSQLWFSGDLGRYADEMMNSPSDGGEADYILIESTYGNRIHPEIDVSSRLADVINRTVERGGVIVIPAFAVGRAQSLLYYIRRLEEAKRIPRLPVFVDSPMAVDASALYCKFGSEANLRIDLTMSEDEGCPLHCPETSFVRSVEESKRINDVRTPAIIIAASGMATGGRVVHHLTNRLPDKKNTILFAGFQAECTRGRALIAGAKDLRIYGQSVKVNAEIASISGLSAHGDQQDLMRWLSSFNRAPEHVFLIHGEQEGLKGLTTEIEKRLSWKTSIPNYMETIILP